MVQGMLSASSGASARVFGSSGKTSVPPVDLQLQNRHGVLALLRTNTQQGMHQNQLRLHHVSAKRGKTSSSGGRTSSCRVCRHLSTDMTCYIGRLVSPGGQEPGCCRDCRGLPGLQTIILLLFHMGICDIAKEVLESIKSD